MNPIYAIILGFAVSIDALIAGMAYGMKNIIISFRSLCIAGIVTGLCTAAAMACAYFLGSFVNSYYAVFVGSAVLIMLGAWNIFQEYLTKGIAPCTAEENGTLRKLTFKLGRVIISIMANPETADLDQSKEISSTEAVFLGLALGIDNMVATFAATLMGMLPWFTPILMAFIQILLIVTGAQVSHYIIGKKLKEKFPYLPGTILILLGISRLYK